VNTVGGGGPETPVPLNVTACGDPAALSVIAKLAKRLPAACGVNATLTVQADPAFRLLPHVFATIPKSPAFVPLIVTELMLNTAFPVLVSVAVWLALVVCTFWLPNERLAGESWAWGTAVAGAFSTATIWPPNRRYSFDGVDGSKPWASVSEAVTRSTKERGMVWVGSVMVGSS
jgi:hypothetical protein